MVQQERGPRELEREAPLSGSQALTRRDLKHQAGRETRGQKVLEQQIQTGSWEETREFRITWALGSGPPQAGEEAGMGEQGAVQDPGLGIRANTEILERGSKWSSRKLEVRKRN